MCFDDDGTSENQNDTTRFEEKKNSSLSRTNQSLTCCSASTRKLRCVGERLKIAHNSSSWKKKNIVAQV